MSKRLNLVVVLAAILSLTLLVFGSAAPGVSNAAAKSPYASALSNLTVGTAVAAGPCNKRSCLVLQGSQFCRSDGVRENCVIASGGGCSVTACR